MTVVVEGEAYTTFWKVGITLKAALLPSQTSRPIEAVKKQLNELLFRYNEELEGVPLAYSELKFPVGKEYGRIMGESYWLHVDISTKLTIFKPVVGSMLQGKIIQVAENYISMLIHGMFNASIAGHQLSKKYKHNAVSNTWENDSETYKEGDLFLFQIRTVQHSNGVLNIDGRIDSPEIAAQEE